MKTPNAIANSNRTGPTGAPAFTLVELLVALALVSILLTMMATIFFRAGRTVSVARASVEIHRNARAALDMMLRDLASAQICNYSDRVGYFSITPVNTRTAFTFTTLATQDGAPSLALKVDPQVALVRYCLEPAGQSVRLEAGAAPRPLYYLTKKVRFPRLAAIGLDMEEFRNDPGVLPERAAYQSLIPPALPVTTDVLALGVLDMQVRVFYAPRTEDAPAGIYYWNGGTLASTSVPVWLAMSPFYLERRPPMTTAGRIRMPALVEVTLEMTDRFGTRSFFFTERFYLPASGWTP